MSSWVFRVDHDAKPLVLTSAAVGLWFTVHTLLTATYFFARGPVYVALSIVAAACAVLACILGAVGIPMTLSKTVSLAGAILTSVAIIFELVNYSIIDIAQSRLWNTEVSITFLIDLACLVVLLILFIRRIKYLNRLFGNDTNAMDPIREI